MTMSNKRISFIGGVNWKRRHHQWICELVVRYVTQLHSHYTKTALRSAPQLKAFVTKTLSYSKIKILLCNVHFFLLFEPSINAQISHFFGVADSRIAHFYS